MMKRQMGMIGAFLAGVLTLVGTSTAEAQRFSPNSRPLYGAAQLRAGFMPDPMVMRGSLGGPVQASQVNSGCRGYIPAQPSHVISTRTGFRNLRFVVSAHDDATLMVMLPNGGIVCDDDGGLRMNPLVQASIGRGDIRVWVGAYSRSAVGRPYTIGFSELNHVNADSVMGGGRGTVVTTRPNYPQQPQVQGGINPNMGPAFGQVNLQGGFMPDPHVVAGQAGGPIRGNQVNSGCRGYLSVQPSHVLMSRSGFRNIRFVVNAGVDLTLMVMLPNGQIVCDDDGGSGANPLVATSSTPGPIRIWVGAYSQSRVGTPYNIGFSEHSSVGTNNIPRPGGGGRIVNAAPVGMPAVSATVVQCQAAIPVTLMGPGLPPGTIAEWQPRGGPATRVRLNGRNLMAGTVNIGSVPSSMREPVITVMQRRNGTLVVRAESPPNGPRDRGEQMLLLLRYSGRPTVAERWTGTAVQRGPRWSR